MEQWLLGGGLLGLMSLMLLNNKEQDKKIGRSFGRLDEVKEYQDKTFTRKDICTLTHERVDEKLDIINGKLDKLLNGGK